MMLTGTRCSNSHCSPSGSGPAFSARNAARSSLAAFQPRSCLIRMVRLRYFTISANEITINSNDIVVTAMVPPRAPHNTRQATLAATAIALTDPAQTVYPIFARLIPGSRCAETGMLTPKHTVRRTTQGARATLTPSNATIATIIQFVIGAPPPLLDCRHDPRTGRWFRPEKRRKHYASHRP